VCPPEVEPTNPRPVLGNVHVRDAQQTLLNRKDAPRPEHGNVEGALVFAHACKLGAEGIVSKRLGSRYRSGRSPDWRRP
jgi:hypothetical protein